MRRDMITHLSLFSGIGGLDLAAERAGFAAAGQCELDPYATKVLEKHWPHVPRWRDIRTLTGDSFREVSYMGAHRKDYNYAVVLYEHGFSVADIANFYGVTRQSMWMCLKRRNAMFRENIRFDEENHFFRGGSKADDHAQNMLEYAIRAGKVIRQTKCEICGAEGNLKDGRIKKSSHGCSRAAQPGLGGIPDGFPHRLDRIRWPAPFGCEQYAWEPPRTVKGMKHRVDRLKCLGNAVVPAQFYPIFAAIAAIERGCAPWI